MELAREKREKNTKKSHKSRTSPQTNVGFDCQKSDPVNVKQSPMEAKAF